MGDSFIDAIAPQQLIKPQKLSEEDLGALTGASTNLLHQVAQWANRSLSCAHCRKCELRCEVLQEPGLDMGMIERDFNRVMACDPDDRPQEVVAAMTEHPQLYHALRRCCFCGFCTATCRTHMHAPDHMREWRQLFMIAGYMPPNDSRLVMVDNEWHIFSAYRAIYNVGYSEFTLLADAAEQGPGTVDTLLFPGCSLVSYAPDVIRKLGDWLNAAGIKWALSLDCCGSPLMSAGMFERAEGLRQRILDQAKAAGIKRVITVCPGCGDELSETFLDEMDIIPLPEVLLEGSHSAQNTGQLDFSGMQEITGFTFFDSCHDRTDNRHGIAIRRLIQENNLKAHTSEMAHSMSNTLCCGAGGAVAGYDPDITQRRVWRVIDEGRDTAEQVMVTMCPTCTYTIAQACLGAPERGMESHHYLEVLFNEPIDWAQVFANLEGMWSGEYGPWLNATFF